MNPTESGGESISLSRAAVSGWLVAIAAFWAGVHFAYRDTLIVHDSWQHIFPIAYAVAKNTACGALPDWLTTVDNGTPVLIYLISFSLTQLLRLPMLYLWSCTRPPVLEAMSSYQFTMYLTYFVFACSMYLLGRTLYRSRFAAAYLFAATLFAGLCLDAAHSNQVVSMAFWLPWLLIAAVAYHRNAGNGAGAAYLNAAVLFFCVQALDQYPHFVLLVTAIAALLYASLHPDCWRALARQASRLWPGLLLLLVTAGQLLLVRSTIADYSPSLRGDLVVDPRAFGETGFVQPTAFLGTILPLSFLSAFETLSDGMANALPLLLGKHGRWFIFRLDALIFCLGVVPLALAAVFLWRGEDRKLVRGWALFALLLLAVSLQQTKLYLVIFHLPFFNVFRSYFLYVVFVVLAVLVMSGYGLDLLLCMDPGRRAQVTDRVLCGIAAAVVLCAALVIGLARLAPDRGALLHELAPAFFADGAIIAAGALALGVFARARRPAAAALFLFAGTALPQAAIFALGYGLVGVTVKQAYAGFGLDRLDEAEPGPLRKRCSSFAQCYLSRQNSVSLNVDLQGTFLRHKDEPVFQRGLAAPVVQALSGLGGAVAWMSRNVEGYADRADLVARLNRHEHEIGEHLRSTTHVPRADLPRLKTVQAGPDPGGITAVSGGAGTWNVSYRSGAPAYLNLATNFDSAWSASVDGLALEPVPANFGGMVVPVPAGTGTVEFRHRSARSAAVFSSRIAMLILALVAAGWLFWSLDRIGNADAARGTVGRRD